MCTAVPACTNTYVLHVVVMYVCNDLGDLSVYNVSVLNVHVHVYQPIFCWQIIIANVLHTVNVQCM